MKKVKMKWIVEKICLILVFVVLICFKITAQSDGSYIHLPDVPSPQTWDFMQYGNVPVNGYTGKLDFQVPIYHYTDPDFDIPVSLGYNSEGLIPSKHSGAVGLNWFLNCGGMITRSIRGIPDDHLAETQQNMNGLRIFSKNGHSIPDSSVHIIEHPNREEIADGGWALKFRNLFNPDDALYESEPDLFHFNFMGHHGSFMISYNGHPHVFDCEDNGAYRVNISGLSEQTVNNPVPNTSEITITTGDGYIYRFGGSSQYLEYIIPAYNGLVPDEYIDEYMVYSGPQKIITWYLKEIEAPNGRKVSFSYMESLKNGSAIMQS